MNVLNRSVLAVSAGLLVLGTAGCTPGGTAGGNDAPPPKKNGLANVDVCGVLTADDLAPLGIEPKGEPDSVVPSEPGCEYNSNGKTITLSKNETKTVDQYGKDTKFDKFEPVTVAGRRGASAISPGSAGTGFCGTLIDAGGGVIIVDAAAKSNVTGFDGCAESMKVAEKIAPRLPQ